MVAGYFVLYRGNAQASVKLSNCSEYFMLQRTTWERQLKMQLLQFQHTSTILRDRLATFSFSFYTIIPAGEIILLQTTVQYDFS